MMIQLMDCGYHFVHEEGLTINRPKGAGHYVFVFFKSPAEVIVDGITLGAGHNMCILLRPGVSHLYKDTAKPFINDWFHCEAAAMGDFLQEIGFPVNTLIKIDDPHWLSRAVLELQLALAHSGRLQRHILDCELRAFFMKLISMRERWAAQASANRHYSAFSRLRNELYNTPHETFAVEALAARLNLSKSYFQHTYKQLFGCSVMNDIINARLEYAKYLLTHSGLPISAISGMCGYENDTHFMRQFKKFVGTSPGRYKATKQLEAPFPR